MDAVVLEILLIEFTLTPFLCKECEFDHIVAISTTSSFLCKLCNVILAHQEAAVGVFKFREQIIDRGCNCFGSITHSIVYCRME